MTFLYEQPGEIPLTPNHLLYGRILNGEQIDPTTDVIINDDFPETSKRITQILKHFWTRWSSEYLTELREHHNQKTTKGYDVLKVDDGVIIQGDNTKQRGMWKVGVVTEVLPSKDGHVRGAKVKYRVNGKNVIVSRPVNKLYPFEGSEKPNLIGIKFIDDKEVELLS